MSDNIVQLDNTWVGRAFLVSDKALSKLDNRNSTWSDAALKYTDTTLGGNYAINPPPQFTRFCDVPLPSRTRQGDGMGPYYSESIDDTSQLVHFRMGEARFNSLASFYEGAYNPEAALAARSGRMNKIFFEIGRAGTYIVSVMSFKLLAVRALAEGYRIMSGAPKSRYYYHTPAMHTYWSAATTILNQLIVNRGIVPRVGGDKQNLLLDGDKHEFTQGDMANLAAALPDVFRKDGGIDLYAVGNKAKRMHRQQQKALAAYIENSDLEGSQEDVGAILNRFYGSSKPDASSKRDFHQYLQSWYETEQSRPDGGADGGGEEPEVETAEGIYAGFKKLSDFFNAEADDGGQFATFRVNYTGSVNESFSNSVGESEIQGKLNNLMSSTRSVNFSLAEGNITGAVGSVISAVKSTIAGGLSSIGLGGIAAIGGSAFFDIPKVWEQSMATMPRSTYTIKLTSPYGNPISQLFDIYIPLSMILAMALPRSSGKQTYTSPYYIEYYDQGRAQTRLGMIDSLSITRGDGSMGFNKDGHAMSITVSLSVIDMSSVMHMPITMGISPAAELYSAVTGGIAGGIAGAFAGPLGAAAGASIGTALSAGLSAGFFDDSTVYSDYLAILAGMGVNDQVYTSRKLKLALTKKLMNWKSWASISNFSSFMGEMAIPGRLASIFYKGIEF